MDGPIDLALIAVLSCILAIALSSTRRRKHMSDVSGLPNGKALDAQYPPQKLLPAGLACVFVDINCFKVVNDSASHAIGNDVLVQTGGHLQALCAELGPAHAFHLHGDEFVVICRVAAAHQIAARLCRVRIPYTTKHGERFQASLSASVDTPVEPITTAECIERASRGLCDVKEAESRVIEAVRRFYGLHCTPEQAASTEAEKRDLKARVEDQLGQALAGGAEAQGDGGWVYIPLEGAQAFAPLDRAQAEAVPDAWVFKAKPAFHVTVLTKFDATPDQYHELAAVLALRPEPHEPLRLRVRDLRVERVDRIKDVSVVALVAVFESPDLRAFKDGYLAKAPADRRADLDPYANEGHLTVVRCHGEHAAELEKVAERLRGEVVGTHVLVRRIVVERNRDKRQLVIALDG